jgi:hypothetical protein
MTLPLLLKLNGARLVGTLKRNDRARFTSASAVKMPSVCFAIAAGRAG